MRSPTTAVPLHCTSILQHLLPYTLPTYIPTSYSFRPFLSLFLPTTRPVTPESTRLWAQFNAGLSRAADHPQHPTTHQTTRRAARTSEISANPQSPKNRPVAKTVLLLTPVWATHLSKSTTDIQPCPGHLSLHRTSQPPHQTPAQHVSKTGCAFAGGRILSCAALLRLGSPTCGLP